MNSRLCKERDVIGVFRKVARRHPDNAAIVTDGRTDVTYAELDAVVMRIAAALRAKGIGPGRLVAISIEKSWQYVAAVFGTWAAGGAFMPLPPGLPDERRTFQIKEAEPDLVISDIESLLAETGAAKSLPHVPRPDDLVYLIYTSGSSGRPKGVMVPHAGLLGVLEEQITLFDLGPDSRSLFLLSIGFDASLSDIGTALLSGAALHIETGNRIVTAARIQEVIAERGITYVDLPPVLLGLLDARSLPPSLRTIAVGGESTSDDVIRRFSSRVRLINVYGPTEATICTSAVVCTASWKGTDIGRPIAGMEYRIMDENGQDAPPGTIGELWIAGPGLASGYLHNDAMNREHFVFRDGKRYYRTGDLVRREGRKTHFVGRRDRQLKVSGQLIAPEEIETQLMAHDIVADAAVVAVHDAVSSRMKLTAFIEVKRPVEEDVLRFHLKKFLPEWMMPSRFVILDKLPRNASGKKDLARLGGMAVGPVSDASAPETSDDLERQLLEIWSGVLGHPVGLDDGFFASGGDSLAVLQATTMAEKRGLSVPIGRMTGNVTVRTLASHLRSQADDTKSDGRPMTDFMGDSALTPTWRKKARSAVKLSRDKNGKIFLTGATGFLGSRIFGELLRRTDRRIIALVRAASVQEGLTRVKRACEMYGVDVKPDDLARLEVMTGDISAPRLGLTPATWKKLASDVSEIYHSAAIVNMVMPYEDLRAANVNGVMEVASLAMTGTRKKLKYASTLSVFVATDRNTGTAMEDDDLTDTRMIYGGYAQSKWVAERFLRQFPEKALASDIFRFGLITGDSVTGIGAAHDYLQMFIRGLLTLGSAPAGDHDALRLDATPVDYAAQAMVFIGQTDLSGCYHVANHGGFSFRMIIDALRDRGFDIKISPAGAWLDEVGRRPLDAEASAAFTALCRLLPGQASFERLRGMDLFQATGISFDTRRTDAALRGAGIIIPPPDRTLLECYLDRILKGVTAPSARRR